MALGKYSITNHLAKPAEPNKIKYPAATGGTTEQEIKTLSCFFHAIFKKD